MASPSTATSIMDKAISPHIMDKILQLPYSEGSFDAKVAIIGEAPGKQEMLDDFSRPFIGGSGQYLRKWARMAGIKVHECYITNVLKERPPDNKYAEFVKANPDKLAKYINVLRIELSVLKNLNLIILVGNTALFTVCGKKGVMAHRGSILKSKPGFLAQGRQVKCIPIIHPAAIMRNWGYFSPTMLDLRRCAYDQNFPELRTPQREYITRPNFNEVIEFLTDLVHDTEDADPSRPPTQLLKPHNVISVDTETKEKGRIATIQLCNSPKRAICIPFQYGSGRSYWPKAEEIMLWKILGRILHNKNIVGQNFLMFDTFILGIQGFNMWKVLRNVYMDTMEAAQCYQPDLPKGLGYLTSVYTREPYYKAEGKEGMKDWAPSVTDKQFWEYGCKDVVVVHEMFPKIIRDLQREGLWEFYHKYFHGMAKHRLRMTKRGLLIDKDVLKKIEKETFTNVVISQCRLAIAAGTNVNVKSHPQMKKLLYQDMKLPKQYLGVGARRRVTCNEDAIIALAAERKSPALNLILEVRRHRTFWSNYVNVAYDSDGRIRSSYGFTETGRFTSRKSPTRTGYNMQNWPYAARAMIRSDDDDHVLIEMDLSQAESRIVAWRSRDRKLMDAYVAGVDMHCRTAANIYGVHISTIEKGTPERYTGKRVNHAANYDMHGKRFSQVYNKSAAEKGIPLITIIRATGILARHHAANPYIRQVYHKELHAELIHNRKEIYNYWGRRMVFHGRVDNELLRKLYAWYAQSTVGDLTNIIFRKIGDLIRIVNQGHDSLLAHVHKSEIKETMKRMLDAAQITMRIEGNDLLVPVDFKVGTHWGKMEEIDVDITV